jgi:hypothetical protein
MTFLSLDDARNLVNEPLSKRDRTVPEWFSPDLIRFMFPIDERPAVDSIPSVSGSPEPAKRTSSRREQDEARRKAMHNLVTNWDKSSKKTAKELVNILFRGHSLVSSPAPSNSSHSLARNDLLRLETFLALIPDSQVSATDIIREFTPRCETPRFMPTSTVGGYSVTETVGPLSMLSEVVRRREKVSIWIKEKVGFSHGRRRVSIIKKYGRIVLFDRHINLVYIPHGNAADNWQFIRGSVVALVQREEVVSTTPIQSSQSSRSV